MAKNPYLDLKNSFTEQEPVADNPYLKLKQNPADVVGSSPRQAQETSFSRRTRFQADAKVAEQEAADANSFGTIARKTITGLPSAAFSLAKTVIKDPIGAAKSAAMGLANGLTLGGVDYLERKAFTDEMRKGYGDENMTDEQIEDLARHTLEPQDPNLKAIRGGADFASILVPYAGVENLTAKGLAYAAPKFVKQYGTAAKILGNIGAWNAIGQTEETFKPTSERNRLLRAGIDTALGVAFPVGEMVFRKIRPTIFNKGAKVTSAPAVETLVNEGEIVSREGLMAGARERVASLESRAATLVPEEKAVLSRLKANLENPDELYKIQQEGIPRPNIGDAKAVINVAKGEGDELLSVATNDIDSLQNFIKGSNEITYKKIDDLGVDAAGNKILARHEFIPKTGKHIIYATDDATASTLAHELGHYFDSDLTKTVNGLSRILPDFKANREVIEDTLASLAVKRLGGEATGDQISKEIKNIANALISESNAMSATRRGGVANANISEQFADAISEVLTREGARGEAPTVTSLLKEVQERKTQKSLGETVAKELEKSKQFGSKATAESIAKAEAKAAPKIKVEPQKFDIVQDKTLGKVAVPRVGSKVSVSGKELTVKKITQTADGDFRLTVHDPVKKTRRVVPLNQVDNIGTLQGMAKDAQPKTRVISVKPTREGTVKEVTKKLERTPTGHKPNTPAIRAEKITADAETEAFLNTKVLSKMTGKERIGKTNDEIITRSLSSKMTEKDFDNILTERFGNLSEDVVKAKRIINDRVQGLRDDLIGKDINNLSAVEMKQMTADYEKLIETVEVFSGVRTELSNSFRSLGLEVVPGENDVLRQVVEQMQKALGKEGDNFTFMQKALKLRENSIVDKYFNIWYPAVLSGPKTTVRNIVGTGMNLVTETGSTLFTKEGRAEFLPRITAMVKAQKDAWEMAGQVMRNKQQISSKFGEAAAFRSSDFKGPFAFLNNLEYVGRFMNAQDIFFSTVAEQGELAAMRAGKFTYGLADDAVIKSLDEGVAKAYAARTTYRNAFENTAISELGKLVTAGKNSENEFIKAGASMIFPFVKTVANVMERQLDYMPILNLWRSVGNANYAQRASRIVKAAGLGGNEADRVVEIIAQRMKHQQMGKMYAGLAATTALAPLAAAGRITGSGPKNKNERDTLMLSGWRPHSIITPGGVVLPYQFMGPLAGILTALGNIGDGMRYNNDDDASITEKFGEGIRATMQSQLDQSFLSGLSSVSDLITGYKSLEDTVADFAANTLIPIPAAWTQTKDILFPERFEANTFMEKIKNKVGATGGLEPKLDTFGREASADLIWGLTPKVLNTKDPVLNWMNENDVFVGRPNRKQTIKNRRTGETREMTQKEYTQFLGNTGKAIYDKMERYVNNGTFNRYSQEKKDKIVDGIVRDIREQEKSRITF